MAAGVLSAATLAGVLVAAPATAAPAVSAATPAPKATAAPRPTSSGTPRPTSSARPRPTSTPPAPLPAGKALAVVLQAGTVLTLPAKDGLRDSTTVRVVSGRSGRVDVDLVRGKKTVHLGTKLALRSVAAGWARTVRVPVSGLTAGPWRIRVQRTAEHGVQARSGVLRVGSGRPVHVAVRPAARTLYPYRDGTLDSAQITVTAMDETDTVVPARGTVRIDAGKRHVTRTLGRAGTATAPVTALPLGAATVTATVTGPAGKAAVRRTPLTLAPTGVGGLRIARSADTVQPVVDGLLDSVVLTTTGDASADSAAKVSGTLTVSMGKTIAAIFPVPDGAQRSFVWNGRVAGTVVPGTYTVTLALSGPQGLVKTKTKTLLVTKQHLPYAVREMFTIAAGNQQGLAVHNGTLYVGYDNGDGTSRIDQYSVAGVPTGSIGPLSIGHAAELSWSTTTSLLYAANGGATNPTTVWSIDPATRSVRDTFDLSALGPNGMVAVDDMNRRLLVFAGTAAGGYTITPIGMSPAAPVPAADGTLPTTPSTTPELLGPSTPIAISGVPQGIELVGQQLWVYTSIRKTNHIAKYDLTTMLPAAGVDAASDLIYAGEGEGLAVESDPLSVLPGWMYVGAHDALVGGPNHLGRLVAVTDAD